MKVSIVLSMFAFACVMAFAPRALPQDAPKEHSMTGCLAKGASADTYMLTDVEKGPKTVMIAESTPNLAPHVGHKIEITGTAVPGKDKTHTMKVIAIKMLSPTCP